MHVPSLLLAQCGILRLLGVPRRANARLFSSQSSLETAWFSLRRPWRHVSASKYCDVVVMPLTPPSRWVSSWQ